MARTKPNHWRDLLDHFGPEKIARRLEVEPTTVTGYMRRNKSMDRETVAALNPLFRKLIEDQKEADRRIEAERQKAAQVAAFQARMSAREEALYLKAEKGFRLLITRACMELEAATDKRFVLDFQVSKRGMVRLDAKVRERGALSLLMKGADGKHSVVNAPGEWRLKHEGHDSFHISEDNIGNCLVILLGEALKKTIPDMDLTVARYVGDTIHEAVDVLREESALSDYWRDYCERHGYKAPAKRKPQINWEGTATIGGWQEHVYCQVFEGQERMMFLKTMKDGGKEPRALFPNKYERLRPSKGFPEMTPERLKAALF